jgi:tRNA(Ile)-lysidine synthase
MTFSAASLREVLEAGMPAAATGVLVAVSGGRDSACLLAAAAQLHATGLAVRAAHVDHGLQTAAGQFRDTCRAQAGALRIPFSVLPVKVDTSAGASIEEAARDARYAAFARELRSGECLLTAHHREDQAETLLLQLLRGAGLKGLAGMPACRPLGGGWHLRPLLDVAQEELHEFGAAHGVCAVADPMNADLRFDRSYLRQRVWPLMQARWPGVGAALARAARHLAEAQTLLDATAADDLQRLQDGDALAVPPLRTLTTARQINVLRHWLAQAGVALPSAVRLGEALRQFLAAQPDHLPAITWDGHALRRYRECILLTDAAPPRMPPARTWAGVGVVPLELGAGLGRLRTVAQLGGIDRARLPDTLQVRRRAGGEQLKPAPQARTQSVQHLCQSFGILPWMRDALPLIFVGAELIAVGDLWLDARWCVAAGQSGLGFAWEDAPRVI